MRAELRFDQDAIRRLQRVIDDRIHAAKVLGPALDDIADDWLNIEQARFGGRAQWKPLSTEWALRKAAGGRSPLPLAGGDLERSLTRKGAKFAVRRVASNSVTLGTSDPVAHLHQDGTKRMPRRPPVSLNQADETRWVEIIAKHLSGKRPVTGL